MASAASRQRCRAWRARDRQWASSRACSSSGAPAGVRGFGGPVVILPPAACWARFLLVSTTVGSGAVLRRSRSAAAAAARLCVSSPSGTPGSMTTVAGSFFSGAATSGSEGGGGSGTACVTSCGGRLLGWAFGAQAARIKTAAVAAQRTADRSSPAITILQAHDVVQLRARDLDELAPFGARDHAMAGQRLDVIAVAGPQLVAHQPGVSLDHQLAFAARQVERLVLALVVLERQRLTGLDVQDLARIEVGVGEDQLIAPGLLHFAYRLQQIGVLRDSPGPLGHSRSDVGRSTGPAARALRTKASTSGAVAKSPARRARTSSSAQSSSRSRVLIAGTMRGLIDRRRRPRPTSSGA